MMKKFLLRLHNFVMYSAAITVLVCVALYGYEYMQTFEKYMRYYHIMPVTKDFIDTDDFQFYSFNESFQKVDTSWNEQVFCAAEGGAFGTFDTDKTNADGYMSKHTYPDGIKALLLLISANGKATPLQENTLRDFAMETNRVSWKLATLTPDDGSTCFVKHVITIYTPIFGIPKQFEYISNPWKYVADSSVVSD